MTLPLSWYGEGMRKDKYRVFTICIIPTALGESGNHVFVQNRSQASILLKSSSDHYVPDRNPVWPIMVWSNKDLRRMLNEREFSTFSELLGKGTNTGSRTFTITFFMESTGLLVGLYWQECCSTCYC